MDYLYTAIRKENKWRENPVLAIEVQFSPDQIDLIDRLFLYEDVLLNLTHSTCLVRELLKQPKIQRYRQTLRLAYTSGTRAEKRTQQDADYERARHELEAFRWRLIRLQREQDSAPAVIYHGNFGAKSG